MRVIWNLYNAGQMRNDARKSGMMCHWSLMSYRRTKAEACESGL